MSNTCASWATSPTTRAYGVAVERRRIGTPPSVTVALVVEEAQQHGGERRLARAARPDDRDPPAGREVEVDAVERPRRVAVARAQPAHAQDRRGRAAGAAPRARAPARGASSAAEHAPGAAAHAGRASCVGRGQAGHELEGGERDERDDREQHGVEPAGLDGGDADDERAPQREPDQQRHSPRPAPAARAAAARAAGELARRARATRCEPLGQRAVDQQLRRALEQVDDRRA